MLRLLSVTVFTQQLIFSESAMELYEVSFFTLVFEIVHNVTKFLIATMIHVWHG